MMILKQICGYDAGKAAGAGDQVGTVLYNRGMYAAMLAAEAIKTAQEDAR